jgi:hypothetical protein
MDCFTQKSSSNKLGCSRGEKSDKGTVAVVARNDTDLYMGALTVIFHGRSDPEMLEALACRGQCYFFEKHSINTSAHIHVQTLTFINARTHTLPL